MAKITVKNENSGERIPFLRGVLVQSIVTAGLSFQDAYQIAQQIRSELNDKGEVTTTDLQASVSTLIRKRYSEDVAQNYESGPDTTRQTSVITPNGKKPFSTTILTRSLEACAIGHEKALDTARRVQDALVKDHCYEIDKLTLRRVVYQNLKGFLNRAAADRYLSWRQFKDSGDPLIIMVGGITGTGKSTITTQLAYRLNVVRTQSTDMLREIVRCYLEPDDVPTLSYSSFEAWKGLSTQQDIPELVEPVSPVIAGFLSQFSNVRGGLEATLSRSVKEGHDLIVDGVHVLPSLLDLEAVEQQAMVVPVMLVVATKEILASRLTDRGQEHPGRASSRYLDHLEQIWELQSYLVDLAEAGKVELIFNWQIEETLLDILDRVSNRICERFPPDESTLTPSDDA
ncbi:MAG: AAA family ATPase [Gammaproteobacteria bacterium]|nr:AAA family ATPase [Gammaproteobacteria bacterium]